MTTKTTTTTEPKTRTITLTGRPPVSIREDQWPQIASGVWYDHDGVISYQANQTWKLELRVRQHADGRAIVYAVYYDSNFQHTRNFTARVGQLVPIGGDLPMAIKEVGEMLRKRLADADNNVSEDQRYVAEVVAECVGNLPAESL